MKKREGRKRKRQGNEDGRKKKRQKQVNVERNK